MFDATTIGLFSIAGNLLGALNRSRPADDFEALKIIDENDPIRRSLEAIQKSPPAHVDILMQDGMVLNLVKVLEIGYGAALLDVIWESTAPVYSKPLSFLGIPVEQFPRDQRENVLRKTVCTIRYSAISAVHQLIEEYT